MGSFFLNSISMNEEKMGHTSSDIDPQILADPSEVIFDPSMIPQMPKTT